MKILGTGSYLPNKVITNDNLSEIVDTSDEWITSRTGIKSRHISEGESAFDLGTKAALNVIKKSGINTEEIDLILLATMTPDTLLPNGACYIQKSIGAVNATCFDINAACSGFLFALNTANAFLEAGMYKNILVVGAETISRIIDWSDRTTCVLFGDGAGAILVTADNTKKYISVTGSDGVKGNALTGGNTIMRNFLINSTEQNITKDDYYMRMDGQEVFKFAVSKVPECIKQVLDKSEKTVDDINYYILHQANVRIISTVSKKLHVSEDKIPVNLFNYGNTSAASIPILLDEMNNDGLLKVGSKLVLSGFGGGLTWGATYMEI